MKLNTVNVIQVVAGEVVKLTSFRDNAKGRKQAETLFGESVRENCGDPEDEDFNEEGFWDAVQEAVDSGRWEDDGSGCEVMLVTST